MVTLNRIAVLNGIPDTDGARSRLKADIPRLLRRASMVNRAIFWSVVASISVTRLPAQISKPRQSQSDMDRSRQDTGVGHEICFLEGKTKEDLLIA
jgi:hypothetical protein